MSAIVHRPAKPSDVPFVFDSWLRSFRLAHAAGPIPMDMYYPVYRRVLERLLARPGVEVLLAEFAGVDVIFGYLVHERGYRRPRSDEATPLVHYCYVRESSRQQGIAAGLFAAAGIGREFTYTFKSAAVCSARLKPARFDPLAVR